jgi:hypothetical protein
VLITGPGRWKTWFELLPLLWDHPRSVAGETDSDGVCGLPRSHSSRLAELGLDLLAHNPVTWQWCITKLFTTLARTFTWSGSSWEWKSELLLPLLRDYHMPGIALGAPLSPGPRLLTTALRGRHFYSLFIKLWGQRGQTWLYLTSILDTNKGAPVPYALGELLRGFLSWLWRCCPQCWETQRDPQDRASRRLLSLLAPLI